MIFTKKIVVCTFMLAIFKNKKLHLSADFFTIHL